MLIECSIHLFRKHFKASCLKLSDKALTLSQGICQAAINLRIMPVLIFQVIVPFEVSI